MKIIILCSGTKGYISPFVTEQLESLKKYNDFEFMVFRIRKKGFLGYLLNLWPLLKLIRGFKPDLIHAHYGLSGLLANLQRRVPVITTFHGSDINDPKILKWSKIAHRLSVCSVFVEKGMMQKFNKHKNSIVIPCGVNLSLFYPIRKKEAQEKLNLKYEDINILFSSDFNNPVKNYPSARIACDNVEKITGRKVNLIEMKNLTRFDVNLFLNGSDCALNYSTSEGSPQFIKEAMACNCPIVTKNVGDVKWVINETEGCYFANNKIEDLIEKVILAIDFSTKISRTNGRGRIISAGLDIDTIAKEMANVYRITFAEKTIKS